MIRHAGATYIIHRRVNDSSKHIRHAQQTGHLRPYMPHHLIFPENIKGFKISVTKVVGHNASRISEKQTITVYVGNFLDEVEPAWNPEELPNFLADSLTDQESRWRSIETALKEAVICKADIVVFPELSVCPDLHDRISLWLDDNPHDFSYVLPGTFHRKIDGRFYNFAELLNPSGRPILSHSKLTTFGTREKHEKISTGSRINLLDTPIGLMAIPICLDFCEEGAPFADLWEKTGADWFLVPAFGGESSINAHKKRAATLYRRNHGAVTVLSNQPDIPEPPHGEKHGFVCFSDSPEFVSPQKRCISVGLKKPLHL